MKYFIRFKDCQKLYTSKIACSILERNHEEFKEIISQSPKSNNDLVRRLVAKSHLEKIALDTMIGQAADRRGYLYTEIKAELNAAKVVANGVIDHLSQIEEIEGMDSKPGRYPEHNVDGHLVLGPSTLSVCLARTSPDLPIFQTTLNRYRMLPAH